MKPRERVLAAFNGQEFDVFPAVSLTAVATVEAMQRANAFYPEAHTDGAKIAALADIGFSHMNFDTVAPYFSILLEAGALGSQIDWGDKLRFPYVKKYAFERSEDIVIPQDYMSKKEIQQLLRSIRILKKRHGDQVAIVGKVMGPWTLAYHLYGVENLVLDTILEPEKTKGLIWNLSEVTRQFAIAQFEAGADIITWAEHVTRDLVSPAIYRDFVLPVHKKVVQELKSMGPVALHVCGNVEDRIALFEQAGFSCFHLDSRNDLQLCRKKCHDDLLIAGGINNPITLMRGKKSQIEKDVEKNIQQGARLVGPECMIQPIIPIKTLRYLTDVIHRQKYRPVPGIIQTQDFGSVLRKEIAF